jgi:hypothetical protein
MKPWNISLSLAALAGLSIASASGVSAQGVEFFAVLSGGYEVGPDGQAAAGDRDGYGTASFTFVGADRFCYAVIVNAIDRPAAMHIHRGAPGRNGPIVIGLTPPTTGTGGTSSGCVSGVSASLLRAIRLTPTDYYVNVHTGAFPAGAVRGQLF